LFHWVENPNGERWGSLRKGNFKWFGTKFGNRRRGNKWKWEKTGMVAGFYDGEKNKNLPVGGERRKNWGKNWGGGQGENGLRD